MKKKLEKLWYEKMSKIFLSSNLLRAITDGQKQPASYFVKISVIFFQSLFKEISRTHQIFQENKKWYKNQNSQEHMQTFQDR